LWFLAKVLQLAVHLYNWTPHKVNGGKSPYFALISEKPKLDKYLDPFGAKVYTKNQTKQNKLLPKLRPAFDDKASMILSIAGNGTPQSYKEAMRSSKQICGGMTMSAPQL